MRMIKGLSALSAMGLAACGGSTTVAGIDGGGALPPPVATTITSQGAITGFGSVIVNGVRFETSGAVITVDGEPATEADLAVGQIVTIQGTVEPDGVNGTANTIVFDDAVEGPIQSLDVAANTMLVLGQTVVVNGDTVFDDDITPGDLSGLSAGDVVEVSGFRDGSGAIVASYIDLEPMSGDFEVTGLASGVDTAAMTFVIEGLTVDYSSAQLDDFPAGMPENGQLVEAVGSTFGAGGELLATEVEFRGDDLNLAGVDDVEVEGLITRFVSASDFDVAGVPVTTTSSTEFENGTAADLGLDVRVEVEGDVNTSGVLVADEIEFRPVSDLRIGAAVEAVGTDGITVFGIDVTVSPATSFEDNSSLELTNFGLTDINVGDYVEIRAVSDGAATVATRIERDDDPGEVFLRALVESVNDPSFTLRGIVVTTDGDTEFEDESDNEITAQAFFAAAQDRVAEAVGALANGGIIAESVSFED